MKNNKIYKEIFMITIIKQVNSKILFKNKFHLNLTTIKIIYLLKTY